MLHPCRRLLTLLLLILTAATAVGQTDAYDADNYRPTHDQTVVSRTNLPIVFIDTRCGRPQPTVIHKAYRVAVRMKIIDNPDGMNYGDTIANPDQRTDYDGWIALRYRGNSSFSLSAKKPLSLKTIETSDVDGPKRKTTLLGMPRDHDWALLAPFNDRSMIRDALMFHLARPFFEYTPRVRHCEVIIDGTYYGVYVMAETPRKGKNRLDLDDPGSEGDALTGGYHLQVDRNDEPTFASRYPAVDADGNAYRRYYRIYFQYKDPDYDEITAQQRQYIQQQVYRMESSLKSDDFADPDTGYRQYLDVTSFIDQQLTQEFSANIDAYRQSLHIYKRRDSQDPRFKTTIWDFNIALGNANYCDAWRTDGWHYQNTWESDLTAYYKIPFWWARLMEDSTYVSELRQRWALYRRTTYSERHITHTIDSLVSLLDADGARERNYQTWPIWGRAIWPVPYHKMVNTWEKEIEYLRTWITERLHWMDTELGYVAEEPQPEPLTVDPQVKAYYNMKGQRLPSLGSATGFVIILYTDGTTKKIYIRP